jgi:hypothetical protein
MRILLPFAAAVRSRRPLAALVLASALVVAGCGGGDSDSSSSAPPKATPDQFPAAQGKTLAQLRAALPKGGPILAPTGSYFVAGSNRLGFGLFTASRAQITNATAAIYIAPVNGGPAQGPYPAKYESLAVKAPFQSETSAKDPDSAKALYVAKVPWKTPGRYQILGMARVGNKLVAATSAAPPTIVVPKERDPVPAVGATPPRIHTPTESEVSGDLSKIDTRAPHDDMHKVDFANVLGKKPVVLVFATPLLCQSRVCGPVVDIEAEVESELRDKADFIHMEIYNDNEVAKGFRPQLAAFHLPTEPWLFVINRQGKITTRIEGAFSADELRAAVQKSLGS